ncbi:hypothetical protein J0H33_04165 [bacterium]|jgi:hypothetical protein|nr:hypothetical protein [bacterium]
MVKAAPPKDEQPQKKERPFRSVIQVANNFFFIVVLVAIALGALAFGLTR